MRTFLSLIALLVFMMPVAASAADAQAAVVNPLYHTGTTPDVDANSLPIPRVSKGASGAFDHGLHLVAKAFDDFYRSEAFYQFALAILVICAMGGIVWKARGLMWNEEELGSFTWWLFFRVTVALICFFGVGPRLSYYLTSAMNSIAENFNTILHPQASALLPGVQAKLMGLYQEQDLWITAVDKRLKQKIENQFSANDKVKRWLDNHASLKDRANFLGTLNYGFPGINYGDAAGYQNTSGWYPGTAPIAPYAGFNDKWGLYPRAGSAPVSTVAAVTVRPVLSAFESAGKSLYNSARTLTQDTTPEVMNEFMNKTNGAVYQYKAAVLLAKQAYVRDYAAWRLVNKDEWGAIDEVEEIPSGHWYQRDRNVPPSEAMKQLLLNLQTDMSKIQDSLDSDKYGFIMGALIPLALGIVGFYCTVSVWVLPIGFTIWSACFLLPKELELSQVLKKGVNVIVVLLFIPVFSNLVVDVAMAFVDAVQAASVEGALGTISAYATGLASTSLVPSGLGPISVIAKAGAFAYGSLASKASDINIFVMAAWFVAFLLIIATPRIVSGIIFATGGFAETLVQKVTVGGAAAAGMTVMGMHSVMNNRTEDMREAGNSVSSVGQKGIAGIKRLLR